VLIYMGQDFDYGGLARALANPLATRDYAGNSIAAIGLGTITVRPKSSQQVAAAAPGVFDPRRRALPTFILSLAERSIHLLLLK
jgi:hypothetical protein